MDKIYKMVEWKYKEVTQIFIPDISSLILSYSGPKPQWAKGLMNVVFDEMFMYHGLRAKYGDIYIDVQDGYIDSQGDYIDGLSPFKGRKIEQFAKHSCYKYMIVK